ncbi:helix-turn-helix domain-containing protein [Saccharicrinis sp. FJH2]|uniref:helix-turn-helix domain-containing protein n=1 Tax=Saccharicrinis sp. FJH65 TaxID=3344659 RepID=UPI0035F423EF
MTQNTTYNNFIESYIKKLPTGFKWQNTPLQIYPLEFISKYLILPTPLLQADYHFFVYLNKGEFNHQVGIETYNIKAPAILYVPEGEAFSIKSVKDELVGFFILLEDKVISSTVSNDELPDLLAIETLINLNADNNQWLKTLCDLLYREISSIDPKRKVGTGLLQALIYKLNGLSKNKKTLSRQNEIAIRFKQLANEHYKTHKYVKFYAKELGVSENYMNRCVKAHFNKSSKQIIQNIIILQSQLLMFSSSKDISEICYDVGIDDPSYFSRLFKKITGQTPSVFKNQIIHGLSGF